MEREHSAPIAVRLITLQFDAALGGFDARPLDSLLADKEVLALREHFFTVDGAPYLACLVTFRARPSRSAPECVQPSRAAPRERVELDDGERVLVTGGNVLSSFSVAGRVFYLADEDRDESVELFVEESARPRHTTSAAPSASVSRGASYP